MVAMTMTPTHKKSIQADVKTAHFGGMKDFYKALAGPSGQTNPARSMFRCSQCFAVVNVLVGLIFEVPQGLSLTGTIDVSAWSMLQCSRYVITRNFIISGRNLTYDNSKSSS